MFQKKSKIDVVSSPEFPSIATEKATFMSDDNEATLSKDASHNDNSKQKKEKENGNEERKSSSIVRTRLLPGRRGRVIERRKACMKRWVERKKALLAATGETVSDTDSIGSDEQLSPVQKARAKTNADKETERQIRIRKVLKSLEIDLTEKYAVIHDKDHIAIGDTDSDTRKTRLHSLQKQQSDKPRDVVTKYSPSSQKNSVRKVNSPVSVAAKKGRSKKSESRANDDTFVTPRSMKSELVIGNTTYVITLILSEPSRLDQENPDNNLIKDCKSPKIDDNSPDKNTDIIDAVQLRRVRPVASNTNSKKYVERCLNIEVEGTELETLKRVQVQLVNFIEKEMKHKLFGGGIAKVDKTRNIGTRRDLKLEDQLKGIIEKAIKGNIESSLRDAADAKMRSKRSTRLSPASVKTAMSSPGYQPKVMIKRLDLAKESKLYKINNVHALKQTRNKLAGPLEFSAPLRKRQSVLPKKYNDYNTSALDSDSDELNKAVVQQETPKRMRNAPNLRTYGKLAPKQSPGANSPIIIRRLDSGSSAGKIVNNKVASISLLSTGQNSSEQKPNYEEAIEKIEGAIAENHICVVCGVSFNSRKDVEAHARTHKGSSVETNTAPSRQTQKPKMMRCRRCQEIVEARYVKAHVCKALACAHKCYVCNSTFRTEKLLMRHLENHDQSEFNIENIMKIEIKKPSEDTENKKLPVPANQEKEQQGQKAEMKAHSVLLEKNDIQSDKVTSTGVKLDSADADKSKETYTCFVCDKIFTDKEILKDHLQKHCDDLSEGEQSNSKEQYQCAICGDTLESDQALEEHVGKHLFDDEDDNPNLISIADQEKSKDTYCCGQCSETFDSELLLEMHMQAHEEDAAIAEWEKKRTNVSSYQCMVCDDFVDTEEELCEHLDVMHNIRKGEAQVCQLCDMSFGTLEDLQEHVAIH